VAVVCPAPPAFVFAPPFLHLLGEAKTQGCEVVLTGDGGDELLLATPAWAADLIRAGEWVQVGRLLKTLIRFWKGPMVAGFRTVLWSYGLRALLRDWAWKTAPALAMRRRRELHAKVFPAWVAPEPRLRRQLESRYEERCERQIGEDSFYLAHLNMFLLDPGTHMVFEEQFYRNSRTGVATLHPFWHRPVADLLLRTPPKVLIGGGRSKSLIRTTMARRFPRLGFEKQKKVLSDDYAREVFRGELPGVWQNLGGARRLAEFGLVDTDLYRARLSRLPNSDNVRELYQSWHGASVETWIRCHV
jgi:asparagine synthetase B (glutamine-hydrolysing)